MANAQDIKYAQDMIPHHEMAVQMSATEYMNGSDTELQAWALNIMSEETLPAAVGARLEPGVGRLEPERTDDDARDFDDGQDDAHCWECGLLHDECECHVGEECGRWRNGVLSGSCTKAGSEECDFECPYSR